MATLNPAKTLKLEHLTGALRPGLKVSHVVAVNLGTFACSLVR
jgi:adenine deaminase